jgi:uncharacterized protein (DUF697 family)
MRVSEEEKPAPRSPGHELRQACRSMARQRAMLAAATSLIPIPGVDLASDLAVMTHLIGRINREFGLSEEQIGRMSKQQQTLAYRLLAGAGGTLAAHLTTPALLGRIVRLAGIRLTAMELTRLVPFAGQLLAACIGYFSIKAVTMRHIAHCEKLVAELENRKESPP